MNRRDLDVLNVVAFEFGGGIEFSAEAVKLIIAEEYPDIPIRTLTVRLGSLARAGVLRVIEDRGMIFYKVNPIVAARYLGQRRSQVVSSEYDKVPTEAIGDSESFYVSDSPNPN